MLMYDNPHIALHTLNWGFYDFTVLPRHPVILCDDRCLNPRMAFKGSKDLSSRLMIFVHKNNAHYTPEN